MTQDHAQWLSRPTTDRTGMLEAAHREARLIRQARATQVAAAEGALRVALAEVNRLRDRGDRGYDWRPALLIVEDVRVAPVEDRTWVSDRGRQLAPCGKYAAYQRHVRRGKDVDPACESAKVERNREHEKTRAPRRSKAKAKP